MKSDDDTKLGTMFNTREDWKAKHNDLKDFHNLV